MKTVIITCTWKSTHEVEVPDGLTDDTSLHDFPPEVLEEMNTSTAELTDWKIRDKRR